MKYLIALIGFFLVQFAFAQGTKVGIFSHVKDIGMPKLKGETVFDSQTQSYHLKGAGYNIWFERDEFHYAI